MERSEQRNYSLDLLRIMAIYFVILTHCATKSQFVFSDGFSSNRLMVQLCNVGGICRWPFLYAVRIFPNTMSCRYEAHCKENRKDFCKVIRIQHGFTIRISMAEYRFAPDL